MYFHNPDVSKNVQTTEIFKLTQSNGVFHQVTVATCRLENSANKTKNVTCFKL